MAETRGAQDATRRRRVCDDCGKRFTTYERIEEVPLFVKKRDSSLEAFDGEKLMRGLMRAAIKRPISREQLEAVVMQVEQAARAAGGEINHDLIGEFALRGLRQIDPVAYIRFASVYKEFTSVDEFESELARLADEPALAESI